MAIEYTYTVDDIWAYPETVNGLNSVVSTVTFTATAVNTETGATASQTRVASLPEPCSGASFTPFSELSEAQVVQFAKDALGASAVETLEETLASQLAQSQPALPWA